MSMIPVTVKRSALLRALWRVEGLVITGDVAKYNGESANIPKGTKKEIDRHFIVKHIIRRLKLEGLDFS